MTAARSSTLTTSTTTARERVRDDGGQDDRRDRTSRRRTGSRRGHVPSVPLGSLTQGGVGGRGAGSTCTVCESTSVTHLTMTLTDGTPARFTSCRTCGERRWDGSGEPLSIAEVIARASKP